MLCVIARIDDAARARLDALCRIVEEFHLPARYLYGHITLVTYLGHDEMEFIARCKAILRRQPAFSVFYNRIELLLPTPSIVASPEMTQQLRCVHAQLTEAAPSGLDAWSSKELWHPHTTLFYHTEADLQAIAERMKEDFLPFSATVSKIEFSKVTDSGYQIMDSVPLRDPLRV